MEYPNGFGFHSAPPLLCNVFPRTRTIFPFNKMVSSGFTCFFCFMNSLPMISYEFISFPHFLEDREIICFFGSFLKFLLQCEGHNAFLLIRVLLSVWKRTEETFSCLQIVMLQKAAYTLEEYMFPHFKFNLQFDIHFSIWINGDSQIRHRKSQAVSR